MLIFQLPNHLFEELVMDIYDEIDRRETEASKFFLVFQINIISNDLKREHFVSHKTTMLLC